MGQRSVAIVHKFIPDYRVPFYSELLRRCAAAEIDLSIIYGDGTAAQQLRIERHPVVRDEFVDDGDGSLPHGGLASSPAFKNDRRGTRRHRFLRR